MWTRSIGTIAAVTLVALSVLSITGVIGVPADYVAPSFAVLGVVVGALMTGAISRESRREADMRARVLVVTSETVALLSALIRHFEDFGRWAPRGGGKIRESGTDGPWLDIDPEEAAEYDRAAAEAFGQLWETLEMLRTKALELGVLTGRTSRSTIEAAVEDINSYFPDAFAANESGELVHLGATHLDAENRLRELVEEALLALRQNIV